MNKQNETSIMAQSIRNARLRKSKDGKEYLEIRKGFAWCGNLGKWHSLSNKQKVNPVK